MKHSLMRKPSTKYRRAATFATVGAALGACCLGMSPAAQAATTVTLQYTCSFPLIGSQPMTASVVWNGAATHQVNQSTPNIPMTVSATFSPETVDTLNLVGATSVHGTAAAAGEVVAPQGEIDRTIALTVGKTAVPTSGSLTVIAAGTLPSVVFTQTGSGEVKVGNTFTLSFTPETASGGQTILGAVNTSCTLDQGQTGVIAAFEILPATTATPSSVSSSASSPSAVDLPAPGAKSSSSSENASGGGTASVVHAGSARVSASSSPVGSARASASSGTDVSAASASASASTAARDPHVVLADAHSGRGFAEALAAVGGAVAAGALALIIWWFGRRRRRADQAFARGSMLPAGYVARTPDEAVERNEADEELHTLAGARRVQVDTGSDRLDVADPAAIPVEVDGKELQVALVGSSEAYSPPHKPVPALTRQRMHARRRQAVALDRYCRERDRHSGGMR